MSNLSDQLKTNLLAQPWEHTQRWLERDHPNLLERINRLMVVDEAYRLDNVDQVLPASNFSKMGYEGGHTDLFRALPFGKEIRPGDWVALKSEYAGVHLRLTETEPQQEAKQSEVKSLKHVSPTDVYWAGTDENEFFYLPKAWCKLASSAQEYLALLSPEQINILCDGEESSLTEHAREIDLIKKYCIENFDSDVCGLYHGPDHWARVCLHAHAVSRSLGVDPLISHIFAWVHDSQREDDGDDFDHGPRAAAFVMKNRSELFGFLSDAQIETLSSACHSHSNGLTHADEWTLACWDADRLDLWRVDIEPNPRYLCTPYAKEQKTIKASRALCFEHEEFGVTEERDFCSDLN